VRTCTGTDSVVMIITIMGMMRRVRIEKKDKDVYVHCSIAPLSLPVQQLFTLTAR